MAFVNSIELSNNWHHTMQSLYRYCLSLTSSSWDAQDLAQETCLKMLTLQKQANTTVNDSFNQEAYMMRTARNLWVDQIRRQANLQNKLSLLQHTIDTEAKHQQHHPLLYLEAEWSVRILLERLSPLQHVVFLLRDLLGYSAADTALLLNSTEGAVKAALHRARAAISNLHQEDNEDHLSLQPLDEHDEELLRSYLAAFRSGQTERLIQLILNTSAHPVALASQVIGQIHNISRQTSHPKNKSAGHSIREDIRMLAA